MSYHRSAAIRMDRHLDERFGAAALVRAVIFGRIPDANQRHDQDRRGRGPFVPLSPLPSDRMLRGAGTLGVINLSVLLLAAVVAERKEADRHRRAVIETLNQALAEIKTLRGLIPICAWCKKIRDSQDYWHSVEDYITTNTDARLSHGMCPDCLAKAKAELDGPPR